MSMWLPHTKSPHGQKCWRFLRFQKLACRECFKARCRLCIDSAAQRTRGREVLHSHISSSRAGSCIRKPQTGNEVDGLPIWKIRCVLLVEPCLLVFPQLVLINQSRPVLPGDQARLLLQKLVTETEQRKSYLRRLQEPPCGAGQARRLLGPTPSAGWTICVITRMIFLPTGRLEARRRLRVAIRVRTFWCIAGK